MSRSLSSIHGEGIQASIGNTPLVLLGRALPQFAGRLWGKLEYFNPAGSAKDRPAWNIVRSALEEGVIDLNTQVVESSSGNMAIGIAQACRYYGLSFHCVTDCRTSTQNIAILRAYGATVEVLSEPDPETGDLLTARLKRVKALVARSPNSFWTNQYANLKNPEAQSQIMEELFDQLGGVVDYVFCAVSSFGTLRGCAEFARERRMGTRFVAIDAIGSRVFGDGATRRLIPGLGSGIRSAIFDRELVDDVVLVSDEDCIRGCRRLIKREAIFAGGSSGGLLSAAEKYLPRIPPGANAVLVFPDRGDRYLDTVYSDEWVEQHFGRGVNWAD